MPQTSQKLLVFTKHQPNDIAQMLEGLGYLATKTFGLVPSNLRGDSRSRQEMKNRLAQYDGIVFLDEIIGDVHALELLAYMPPEWPGKAVIMTESCPRMLPMAAINLTSGISNGPLPGFATD